MVFRIILDYTESHIIANHIVFRIELIYMEYSIIFRYTEFRIEAMIVSNPRELGALIRQGRTNRGLSQAALAERVGTYQPAISEVEKGQSGVRISLILQIIKALGLTLDIRDDHAAADQATQTSRDDLDELDAIANTGLKK